MQRHAVEAVWPGSLYLPFANPPPAAWLLVPFTLLSFGAALFLWTVLSVALLLGLSQAYSPAPTWQRAAFALSVVGFLPVFVMVEAAPLSPVAFLGVAGCALLLKRGNRISAGLALSLIAVKPNLALLVPPVLLAAGQLRTFVSWLAATAVMVLVSVAILGQHGLEALIALNVGYVREPYHLTYSLASLLGGPVAYALAATAVAVLTLVIGYARGRADPGLAIAAGIVGTLLMNHHLTPADFIMLLVPVWVCLGPDRRVPVRLVAGGLWAAGWMSSLGLAWPVAVIELVLLLSLLAEPLMQSRGPAVKTS